MSPHEQQLHGERQLGLFDWLFKSPTAEPDTPAPAFGFGKYDNLLFGGLF
ncbi:hypothetical protein F441_07042 [Phytophthora nicotianae CJ01A1]|uniref:Uncharacterized protein n=6 Tax=Phytophthora nicotianae TaxID=4792 RepID=W2QF48_PHYN3|nr:hypothetical protein PPTG_22651 [Phytophthora nicotianae INRA-310]ETI49038.1 hypothetical protein F443_07029 [Phytophthora nicotianae P1569]ETK88906.1 hypothetical protein L915_06931 [Phytophthora nicotianae]ETO77776.1 hypothetical protein F444_07097 [Phytophthora nicotianae P1976]ETP18805.1 hypothetical protein F441_07042 [Phytophthora nicotianae CJ01A1]ETP46726.1 hypothetical protein F442_07093 [Phytophthora nicotianae P10297]